MTPSVSVIIPVFRDWERLDSCLAALDQQTLAREQTEIIVADNELEPHARPSEWPSNVRLIHEPRPGSYAARNAALQVAAADVIAFTDSDCVPSPHWLERGLALVRENPSRRVTGPITIFRESGTSRFAFLYDFHTAFPQERLAARGRCPTANLIVARSVIDHVGPFDEALVSGGDSEWGDRAQRAGFPLCYDAHVTVAHPARRTLADILKKKRRLAGSVAERKSYPTWPYFLLKLLPPANSFVRALQATRRGRIGPWNGIVLYFVHWAGRIVEAQEFLFVRKGWKRPNRS